MGHRKQPASDLSLRGLVARAAPAREEYLLDDLLRERLVPDDPAGKAVAGRAVPREQQLERRRVLLADALEQVGVGHGTFRSRGHSRHPHTSYSSATARSDWSTRRLH